MPTRPTAPAREELTGLPLRLRQSQEDVDDAETALAARREQRRLLVHETIDQRVMSHRQVAAALGRGTGLVSKILATPEPEG